MSMKKISPNFHGCWVHNTLEKIQFLGLPSQEKHLYLNHSQHGRNYLGIIGTDPPGPPKRLGGKGEADFILMRFSLVFVPEANSENFSELYYPVPLLSRSLVGRNFQE